MADDLDMTSEMDDVGADLRTALEGTGWNVKDAPAADSDDTPDPPTADAEPPADGDGDDLRGDLRDALNETGPPEADAATEAAWSREQRRLADQVLEGLGVDPAQRHEKGLSRREVFRRLAAAEHGIRTDPAGALPALIRDYGGRLDEAGKMRLAAGALSALGMESAGQISAADRQRLTAYEQEQSQRDQAMEQARPQVERQVQEFAASRADFQQLRPLMGALVSSGQAQTLEQAYDMARRASGVHEQAAQAADDARRSKVAAARAAGTPQTRNAPGKASEPHKEQSLRDDLRDALREGRH